MDLPALSAYGTVAAAAGQIISAIAVVLSLLYLARQLSQNTQALRVATYQADVSTSVAILGALYTSADLAELQVRAHTDPASLSPADTMRWDNYMLVAFRHLDSLFYQYRIGSLEPDLWHGYEGAFTNRLRHEVWVKWFEANRSAFSPALQVLVRERREVLEGTRPQAGALPEQVR